MSVSSINNAYGNYSSNAWGLDFNNLNESSSANKNSSGTSKKASGAYSGNSNTTLGGLAEALSGAMNDLGLSANDKITFQTLMDYRDKLGDQFTEQVKKDLLAAGVDKDVNFKLVSGQNGSGIEVVTDDPAAKAQIEKYFKDNPDKVTQFEKIQSLNKMDETRKSENIDTKSIRSRLQMEAMTQWYATDTSGFMAFSGQGAAYYSGVNTMA